MNGLLNVFKPTGITSHDVVNWARQVYQTKKIGHAGTLDPGAAGVVVLGINKGTKLTSYVQDLQKSYRVEMQLGAMTESCDAFSPIKATKAVPSLDQPQIETVLHSCVGSMQQIPPMTSAVKVGGQKLYELARKGQTIERPSRTVEIYQCSLVTYLPQHKKVLFDVACSKGTYIRTLCVAIAERLGTVGYMSFLLRTQVGHFHLKDSNLMTNLKPVQLEPMHHALAHWPQIILNEQQSIEIKNGRCLRLPMEPHLKHLAALNGDNDLLALLQPGLGEKEWCPFKVFIT